MNKKLLLLLVPLLVIAAASSAFGAEPEAAPSVAETASSALFTANNIWMLVSTFLVFIMHLGFSCIETGLTQAKNTVNILFKNVAIVAIGTLTYAAWGFNVMYPGEAGAGGWFAFGGFGISAPDGAAGLIEYAGGAYTYWTDFIFQAMFAATAATIVSGAVAERIKVGSFVIFSVFFVGLVYPIAGMWKWGGGWANAAGFYDFAGSTLVHSVGGWGALAGAIVLGPRIGKYVKGQVRPIFGHNLPLATIGMFLLWFGWYGFNGGSVLSGDPGGVSLVFVTTTLGACAGVIGAMATSWIISKKPDLSMVLNGALAGLVGITAGADIITPMESIIIGGIAGVVVYFAVLFFDKVKIDDPVGAISVHLVCGIWGTLATGIFGEGASVVAQLKGIAAYGAFAFPAALILFFALKYTIGLRVSREEELGGLDKGEHSAEAYAGFQILN
ncbi:MAG: ammonium transporter [Deltaproteobacteria bacterium]|nr:ammonium transporter [Deltaproteobacteria bacterium]MBN2672702.1 ammonium transporter [Deltaproteobacteria bacterium]